MKYENLKVGDIYKSKTHPHKDFKVSYVNIEYDEYDKIDHYSSFIMWELINKEAFDKFICEKKNVDSIEELFNSGRNTYPWAWSGDMKIRTFKQYLRKYNFELEVSM